ncbi:MAG: dual specificity protein phosphatase family protein [Candidatus Thorarchaeota archaeon]
MASDIFRFRPQLYGSSLPSSREAIEIMQSLNIAVVVSFARSRISFQGTGIEHIPFPVQDFGVPSRSNLEEFLQIVEERLLENKNILVHCYAGCGRTGIMLAVINMFFFGEDLDATLERLLSVRPCAREVVNNPIQYQFLEEYEKSLKRGSK